MQYIEICGNNRLDGSIAVQGAKNSALPILAGAVLTMGESVLSRCPDLSDVDACLRIIRCLGGSATRSGDVVTVSGRGIGECAVPQSLMREMRSSIIFLGSVAARCGRACMYLPGGCKIGARPIDLHLKALRELGYKITFDGSNICCERANAHGGTVKLAFPSVGATENVILASVLLSGRTTIINAAREPEICDLADYLNSAGAKISGAGSTVIEIEGVTKLHSAEHTVMPDRIAASTLMCAAASASGRICLKSINSAHVASVIDVFRQMGGKIAATVNEITVEFTDRPRAVNSIVTGVYPGFPTDSQAPVMAALCKAHGRSAITETIFENRLQHVHELRKFGADIKVCGNTATVTGVNVLNGANVNCTDLRGGAALIIAALGAQGKSRIYNIEHIDRGYENTERQLAQLGADIRRVNDEKGQQTKTQYKAHSA
ncbi:MAG: UDP-N-acetylglucosamine 1-carboxyvinyltransferase [Eubacterium sp.]|nr:UDP-N-acetylglucosamine 1-carboxyvinyltransferase [Eubacterium sp.]